MVTGRAKGVDSAEDGYCHCNERPSAGSLTGPCGKPVEAMVMKVIRAAAGVDSGEVTAAATQGINVFDSEYTPDPTIHVGDTVVWTWTGGLHSVTSADDSPEAFDSGLRSSFDAPFSHTFLTPGTYTYYCILHGFVDSNGSSFGMVGQIEVLPVPEPAIAPAILGGAFLVRRVRRPRKSA
jgi:plastocyanin